MLEALTPETIRQRLGLAVDNAGAPTVGPIAEATRACVHNWRSPARARVAAYLHRQLIAAGFDEEQVRERVSDTIDALIDIGDLTAVRIDGKRSLVLSRRSIVSAGDRGNILLGAIEDGTPVKSEPWRYSRIIAGRPEGQSSQTFSEWLGPADFRRHLARRLGGSADGTITEYWAALTSALQHDGNPLDATLLRAVIDPPSAKSSYFGRHNLPIVTGRWTLTVPNGTWCGVRPGRNPSEWHPIIAVVAGSQVQALDLYDWDEWNWALLARGKALGAPERSTWQNDNLAFEFPVPRQFVRAMRLLGGPGERNWTWRLSEEAHQNFEKWCSAEL